jgi:hypothetical protein
LGGGTQPPSRNHKLVPDKHSLAAGHRPAGTPPNPVARVLCPSGRCSLPSGHPLSDTGAGAFGVGCGALCPTEAFRVDPRRVLPDARATVSPSPRWASSKRRSQSPPRRLWSSNLRVAATRPRRIWRRIENPLSGLRAAEIGCARRCGPQVGGPSFPPRPARCSTNPGRHLTIDPESCFATGTSHT